MKNEKPEFVKTKSGRVAAIYYRTVGQAFGTYAVLKVGKETLGVTEDRPYGFTSAAREDALALAARL